MRPAPMPRRLNGTQHREGLERLGTQPTDERINEFCLVRLDRCVGKNCGALNPEIRVFHGRDHNRQGSNSVGAYTSDGAEASYACWHAVARDSLGQERHSDRPHACQTRGRSLHRVRVSQHAAKDWERWPRRFSQRFQGAGRPVQEQTRVWRLGRLAAEAFSQSFDRARLRRSTIHQCDHIRKRCTPDALDGHLRPLSATAELHLPFGKPLLRVVRAKPRILWCQLREPLADGLPIPRRLSLRPRRPQRQADESDEEQDDLEPLLHSLKRLPTQVAATSSPRPARAPRSPACPPPPR